MKEYMADRCNRRRKLLDLKAEKEQSKDQDGGDLNKNEAIVIYGDVD